MTAKTDAERKAAQRLRDAKVLKVIGFNSMEGLFGAIRKGIIGIVTKKDFICTSCKNTLNTYWSFCPHCGKDTVIRK